MRILITGARGMLGTDACRFFTRSGHDVVGVDLPTDHPSAIAALDICDARAVREMFSQVCPDLVLHCAAYTNVDGSERDPEAAHRVNAFGTWSVASAAEAVGAALVAISTDFVFDGRKGSPYLEVDRPNPLSAYGASKLAGEELALAHCSRTYVVRTSWLYGVHGGNFPYAIIRRAKEKGELSVVADQFGTPTYTQDLVRAVDVIVREPLYGIYHASNDGETSWFEFARAVLGEVGMESIPVHPLTSAEYASAFGSPTERPARSVLRNWSMEMRGLPPMRPWEQALVDFVDAAKSAGKM